MTDYENMTPEQQAQERLRAKYDANYQGSYDPMYGRNNGTPNVPQTNPADTGSFGWAVLGFFIPLVGLILYLVWKSERPKDAKQAGKGALISVIVSVVLWILLMVLGIGVAFWGASAGM